MTSDAMPTADRPVGTWLESLGSDAPTPGGGAFAGVAGAAGAAMVAMVARLTLGRAGFEAIEARMNDIVTRADDARVAFLELADRDAAAFEAVMGAFRMPKGTDDEKAARSAAVQEAFAGAAAVPMEVARLATDLLPDAVEATSRGNPNAASDGYSGAAALHAAALCAIANVEINAASLKDPIKRTTLLDACADLRSRAAAQLQEAEQAFQLRLSS
jgi:formiminotetrahydrofolate cyclodeaminase